MHNGVKVLGSLLSDCLLADLEISEPAAQITDVYFVSVLFLSGRWNADRHLPVVASKMRKCGSVGCSGLLLIGRYVFLHASRETGHPSTDSVQMADCCRWFCRW